MRTLLLLTFFICSSAWSQKEFFKDITKINLKMSKDKVDKEASKPKFGVEGVYFAPFVFPPPDPADCTPVEKNPIKDGYIVLLIAQTKPKTGPAVIHMVAVKTSDAVKSSTAPTTSASSETPYYFKAMSTDTMIYFAHDDVAFKYGADASASNAPVQLPHEDKAKPMDSSKPTEVTWKRRAELEFTQPKFKLTAGIVIDENLVKTPKTGGGMDWLGFKFETTNVTTSATATVSISKDLKISPGVSYTTGPAGSTTTLFAGLEAKLPGNMGEIVIFSSVVPPNSTSPGSFSGGVAHTGKSGVTTNVTVSADGEGKAVTGNVSVPIK